MPSFSLPLNTSPLTLFFFLPFFPFSFVFLGSSYRFEQGMDFLPCSLQGTSNFSPATALQYLDEQFDIILHCVHGLFNVRLLLH